MDILTIDCHPIYRLGIRTLLQAEQHLNPAGEVDSITTALAWLARRRADIALLDRDLPDRNGIEGMADLLAVQPDLKIVMLTANDGVEDVVQALRNGACGYLLKGVSPEKLLQEIRSIGAQAGGHPATVAPEADDREFVADAASADPTPPADLIVTPRETRLLSYLCQGLSNKEIARELGLSPHTVRNQLQNLQDRSQTRNRVQLALLAREIGCVERLAETA